MQVAADLLGLDKGGRLARERLLAQLRRAPRQAQRRVHAELVGRVGQRLERGDVRGRARRADQFGPVALGLDHHQLERYALDRQPDRSTVASLEQRDDLRQRGEAREHGRGRRRGARRPTDARHASRQRRTSPAAVPPSALRNAVDELHRAIEQESLARPRLAVAGERLEQPRLGLGPDPGHGRAAAVGRRVAQLAAVRTPSDRASSTQRLALSPR